MRLRINCGNAGGPQPYADGQRLRCNRGKCAVEIAGAISKVVTGCVSVHDGGKRDVGGDIGPHGRHGNVPKATFHQCVRCPGTKHQRCGAGDNEGQCAARATGCQPSQPKSQIKLCPELPPYRDGQPCDRGKPFRQQLVQMVRVGKRRQHGAFPQVVPRALRATGCVRRGASV